MVSRPNVGQQIMKSSNKRKPLVGSGKRFKQLVGKLKKNPKVTHPKGLAAAIGRKKYGEDKFNKMAAKGRQRKRRS